MNRISVLSETGPPNYLENPCTKTELTYEHTRTPGCYDKLEERK